MGGSDLMGSENLDIILASHNHVDLTIGAINALYSNTTIPFTLTIVDDSTDSLTSLFLSEITQLRDNVKIIRPEIPYTHGNQIINAGLQNTTSPFVVYLGNSTLVEPQWADVAWAMIHNDPKIGIIGFKLLQKTGIIEHAGIYWEPWMPYHMNFGPGEPGHRYTFVRETPAVGFALVMLRREAFPEGLDETTFLGFRGFDDVDACFEAKKRGWKILYCGMGAAYHEAGATRYTAADAEAEFQYTQECEENRRRFLEKWGATQEAKNSVTVNRIRK